MKIVSGLFKGRIIETPQGNTTRPSSERLRAQLFNIAQNEVEDSIFLDLFAGSGAIGLEALSRGAKFCVFVESNRNAVSTINTNRKTLQVEDKSRTLFMDVLQALKLLNKESFKTNLVFLDPPYSSISFQEVFSLLEPLLTDEASVFLEESAKCVLPTFEAFFMKSVRKQGDSALWHFIKNK